MNRNRQLQIFCLIMMGLVTTASCTTENKDKKTVSYIPTEEFRKESGEKGITEEMIENSVNDNGSCAQYLMFIPRIEKQKKDLISFQWSFPLKFRQILHKKRKYPCTCVFLL